MENNDQKMILLAEDDKFISRAYNDGLSRAGYEIVLAMDGEEALSLAVEKKPDLILLDLIMPVMNGFEALEELKKNDETKDIPVIILSNLGQDTDITKGKEMGAVDYLIKSNYSMQQVVAKIKNIIPQ